MMSLRWCVIVALAAGCGAAGLGDDGGNPDAGVDPYCNMNFSFDPVSPTVGQTITVYGSIYSEGLSGAGTYTWSVSFGGSTVQYDFLDPTDDEVITFLAGQEGQYRVVLMGSMGGEGCTDEDDTIGVAPVGAATETFRFRFLPASSQQAPVQEKTYELTAQQAINLGEAGLDNGSLRTGTITDAGNSPLRAYIRLTDSGSGRLIGETFSNASGEYSIRLLDGTYDVLVIPEDNGVAPAEFAAISLFSIGSFQLQTPDTVTGVVQDGGGDPVVGAVVSLRVDGVPSTLATTNSSGAFTLSARAGSPAIVSVVPVAGSGLPVLEVGEAEGVSVANGTTLALAYSASLTSRTVSINVLQNDDATPAANTPVTWIAGPIAGAGSVVVDGGTAIPAEGSVRVTVTADGSGAISGLVVPEANYWAVVARDGAPTGQYTSLVAVDLTIGNPTPASVSLAALTTVTGRVTSGGFVSDVVVTAVPRGPLANVAAASAMALTSSDGTFTLTVVGGGMYDLVLQPTSRSYARAYVDGVVGPAAGGTSALGDLPVKQAMAVDGSVRIPGVAGGAAGVAILVLCTSCSGLDAERPLAEAVTDSLGEFSLAIARPEPPSQ